VVLSFLLQRVAISHVAETVRMVRPAWLLAAFLLLAPNLYVQTAKWRYLLRLAEPAMSIRSAFRSLLIGYPLGFVTPGRVGELGRAFFVEQLPKGQTLKLVVFDKLSTLVVTLSVGALAFLFAQPSHGLTVVVRIAFVALVLCMVFFCSSRRLTTRIAEILKVERLRRRHTLRILLYAALFNLTFYTQLVALALAMSDVDLIPAYAASAVALAAKSMLPVALADLGIREGAIIYFFSRIGLTAQQAFAAGFMLFLINIVIPTLAGLPLLLRTRSTGSTTHEEAKREGDPCSP